MSRKGKCFKLGSQFNVEVQVCALGYAMGCTVFSTMYIKYCARDTFNNLKCVFLLMQVRVISFAAPGALMTV